MSDLAASDAVSSVHMPTVWPVRIWLFLTAALVFAMVIVGGATRLTDSGLSITEWLPILGAVPPLNEADWQEAFAKYRQIPEYKLVNKGMSLEEFKFIYWWEWAHRFLGRFIGLAFFVPLVLFWLAGRIPGWLKPHLVILLVLGGMQGALGWYMVSSGLVDRVDVSQYRLAAHLSLAVAIFGYLFWLGLRLGDIRARRNVAEAVPALMVGALVFVQIVLGAFVAGLRAGHGYNTWPLMDGSLVPQGLFSMSPAWINLFENAMTVQFLHRSFAYVVLGAGLWHASRVLREAPEGTVQLSAGALGFTLFVQFGLGIWALVMSVPIALGLLHQAGAVVLLAAALWNAHALMCAPERG
ncbi:MAG: COX15/CtaA family protein [Pseudomonadota bacterium]